MLNKVQIFTATHETKLKALEERKNKLEKRANEIKNSRGEGLYADAMNKIAACAKQIRDIDFSQDPNHGYYIKNVAERAQKLASKETLEAERDQTQAELDALKYECEQILKELDQIENEQAPFEALQELQDVINKKWPTVVAVETAIITAAKIGPDMVVSVLAPLIDAFCECRERLEPELQRNRKLDAEAIKADFDAFLKAGFNTDQAMQITLARVKENTLTSVLQMASAARK